MRQVFFFVFQQNVVNIIQDDIYFYKGILHSLKFRLLYLYLQQKLSYGIATISKTSSVMNIYILWLFQMIIE
ncbi:MAG TPA: hypothetical protein DDW27_02510 [Bacteroidales bacterium]|nr:hypothetical protein [Bacteroidales bacterium]